MLVEGNYSIVLGLLQSRRSGFAGFAVEIIGQDWSDAVVILDESEQGVKHVATSSTCAERRAL